MVTYTATAHYDWGGDEIISSNSLQEVLKRVKKYVFELETEYADEEDCQAITIMPNVDGQDVPTLCLEWQWPGWSGGDPDMCEQDVLDELEGYGLRR